MASGGRRTHFSSASQRPRSHPHASHTLRGHGVAFSPQCVIPHQLFDPGSPPPVRSHACSVEQTGNFELLRPVRLSGTRDEEKKASLELLESPLKLFLFRLPGSGSIGSALLTVLHSLRKQAKATPQVCLKCAVRFGPVCAKVRLFNTSAKRFRAGSVIGKRLIYNGESSKEPF